MRGYFGVSKEKMVRWALRQVDSHRDRITKEVNLTELEENVRNEFKVPDREWDDLDMSYEIWYALDQKGLIE